MKTIRIAFTFLLVVALSNVCFGQEKKKVEKDTVAIVISNFLKRASKEVSTDKSAAKKAKGYKTLSVYYDPKQAILSPVKNGLLIYTH